jgi:hypothetical protein
LQVRFIVETDGSISNIQSLNDPGFGFAAASEKMMQRSPKWQPATQNKIPVRSYHTQPITFVISEQNDEVITISSPHPGTFFLGVENPLKISSSQYKSENLVVQISNGSIEKRDEGYIVRVNQAGKTIVSVKVNENGWKDLATTAFEVKPLPPYSPAKTEKIFIDGIEYKVSGTSPGRNMDPRRTDGLKPSETSDVQTPKKRKRGSQEEVTLSGYPLLRKS